MKTTATRTMPGPSRKRICLRIVRGFCHLSLRIVYRDLYAPRGVMRSFRPILIGVLVALSGCAGNNDNAHTTATTIVPPPPRQQLHASTRPASKFPAQPNHEDPHFNPKDP